LVEIPGDGIGKLNEDLQLIQGIGQPMPMVFDIADPANCFPMAWQNLTKTKREAIVFQMTKRRNPAFSRIIPPMCATELARQASCDARLIKRRRWPSIVWADGEDLMLHITWADLSDTNLAHEFRKWAKINRPPYFRKLSPCKALTKGKHCHDFEVALRRLGILRLNYFYTLDGLRTRCPEADRYLRQHQNWYKEWFEGPAKAKKFFLDKFPFLKSRPKPSDRKPIHFTPERRLRGKPSH